MKNHQLLNPFDVTPPSTKKQYNLNQRSELNYSNNPLQSSQKKSNRIKQAKQLLAKKLKEVTSSHCQHQYQNIHIKENVENILQQKKAWQCHMNPISKLTRQPFVRSKTCDQLRKEFSLKKQRKKNNSASKYNTPNTNTCERDAQSTGVNSRKINLQQNSSWVNQKSSTKNNNTTRQSPSPSPNIETQQFSFDPFHFSNNHETFDQQQIKKLSQDGHKNKLRGKVSTGRRVVKEQKEMAEMLEQMSFPFRINTVMNRKEVGIGSPMVLQASFRCAEGQFTPKLERYGQVEEREKRVDKRRVNGSFDKIELNEQLFPAQSHQVSKQAGISSQQDQQSSQKIEDSFCYSSQNTPGKSPPYEPSYSPSTIPPVLPSSGYPNEVMANLQLNNTILEEKLKLKEMEIEQLNHNYFQLKAELLGRGGKGQGQREQMNNGQCNNTSRDCYNHYTGQTHISQPYQSKIPKYLTNLELEIVHSIDMENNSSDMTNSNNEVLALPSPKFCQAIQEEFQRQRPIHYHHQHQHQLQQQQQDSPVMYQRIRTPQQGSNSGLSRFHRKKELFSSEMSEQVSEQFDSEEIQQTSVPSSRNHSRVVSNYGFKKSHFYEEPQRRHSNQNKRDSLVYTLNDDYSNTVNENLSVAQFQQKQINPSFLESGQKKEQSHIISEEMLLESQMQRRAENMQFSSDDKLNMLSPIKSNEVGMTDMPSIRYMKYRHSSIRTENVLADDSLRKFDYYLTPQKDDGHEEIGELKQQANQGLFEKAFSTLRKLKNDYSQLEENSRAEYSDNKKQQLVDTIIQLNFQ